MTDQEFTDIPTEYLWPEALRGVEAKVRRAKAHTEYLKDEVNRFTRSDEHRYPIERNADGSQYFGRVLFDPIPDPVRWGVIVGEIAHNLRSALNVLAWQLVIVAGERPDVQTDFRSSRIRLCSLSKRRTSSEVSVATCWQRSSGINPLSSALSA